ncbi:hypothetical protein, partial [Ekhidna sp.]|uniref:hypothetical protein n=1 Tax=Ekhidna sp. TaxID=2608089 RepID=UPI0032994048
ALYTKLQADSTSTWSKIQSDSTYLDDRIATNISDIAAINTESDADSTAIWNKVQADSVYLEGRIESQVDSDSTYLKGLIDANTSNISGLGALANLDEVNSSQITNDAIVNDDINSGAAIAGTKISPNFGSQTITTTGALNADGVVDLGTSGNTTTAHGALTVTEATTLNGSTTIGDNVALDNLIINSEIQGDLVFEGSVVDGNTMTLSPGAANGSNFTVTLPQANTTLIGDNVAQTLTNKTLTSPTINTATIEGGTIGNTTAATIANVDFLRLDGNTLSSTSGNLAVNATAITDIDGTGVTIDASSSTVAINAAAGAINIGNAANAQPINIGTGAAARTITLGNNTVNSGTTMRGSATSTTSTSATVDGALAIGNFSSTVSTSGSTVTIANRSFMTINDTHSGATTFSIGNGNTPGQMLVLVIGTYTGGITLNDSGNVNIAGNWTPDSTGDTISLIWTGSNWVQLHRSNN